jgi:hypothetical protein
MAAIVIPARAEGNTRRFAHVTAIHVFGVEQPINISGDNV